MGFIGDVFEAIGDFLGDVVDAIGDVFEWVGDAISGLLENPVALLLAGATMFFGAPLLGTVGSAIGTAAEAAAAGAAGLVETVAGGAGFLGQVLGTGAELVAGTGAFEAASAAAASAASGAAASGAGIAGSGFLEAAGGGSMFGETLAGGMGAAPVVDATSPLWGGNVLAGANTAGVGSTIFSNGVQQVVGGGSGGLLGGIGSFVKNNKELISLISNGIQGHQKQEMEEEMLDWKKKVAEQNQKNWEAIHQPYDFSLYDPGAALQNMNANLFNSGYLRQSQQLANGGYQPQYLINDPNSAALPNYQNLVRQTYGKDPYATQGAIPA